MGRMSSCRILNSLLCSTIPRSLFSSSSPSSSYLSFRTLSTLPSFRNPLSLSAYSRPISHFAAFSLYSTSPLSSSPTLRFLSTYASDDIDGIEDDPHKYETSDETSDGWEEEEEEDVEAEIGDGGDGGGIVLQNLPWGERVLSIAREVLLQFGSDMELFSLKTTPRGYIYVRLDKLSNKYGCPSIEEIESYNQEYKRRLDEIGALGEIPHNLAIEVSSPGAERLLKVPDDLERFKDMPMIVSYVEDAEPKSPEKQGVFLLESVEKESSNCVWKLANVRENRDHLGKGRPLSRKQKDWRLRLPFEMCRRALAKEIREYRSPTDGETRMFYEIVVAPKYSKKGLEILRGKSKTLRILEAAKNEKGKLSLRQVGGGWLAQDSDDLTPEDIQFKLVSEKAPQESELGDAEFAWLCVKHVKSNAIVIAKNNCMLGMGSGQPNRLESLRIAMRKAGDEVKGAALASDAFFPFAWNDAVEEACQSGIGAIAEPGGSIRDNDAIDCCNKYGVSLLFTNVRHFRH